jgi:hypothetical protein
MEASRFANVDFDVNIDRLGIRGCAHTPAANQHPCRIRAKLDVRHGLICRLGSPFITLIGRKIKTAKTDLF